MINTLLFIFQTQEAAHYAAELLSSLVLRELEQIEGETVYPPYRQALEKLYDQLALPVYNQLSNQVFDDDLDEHFMDDDARPQGYELEQWQTEMALKDEYYTEAAAEEEVQADYEE